MSLFLSIRHGRKHHASPALMRCNDLYTEFGIDSDGNLSLTGYKNPLLSVQRKWDSYFFLPHQLGFECNSIPMDQGEVQRISAESAITSPWCSLNFAITSSESESFWHIENGNNDRASTKPVAKVTLALGPYARSLLIAPNQEFTIGKHDKCDLQLPYEGVKDVHLKISASSEHICLSAVDGKLSIGEEFITEVSCRDELKVQLEPLRLPLLIEPFGVSTIS